MNDQLRLAIMLVVSNGITLGTAFGLQMSGDQVGAITSFVNSTLLLVMFFWKNGQQASGTSNTLTASVTATPTDADKG